VSEAAFPHAQQLAGVLFDFDGTLAPNLDLPDLRRRVIEVTRQAGVPDAVFADRYIVEIIDAAGAWLAGQAPAAGAAYARRAHQLITDFELAAASTTDPFPGIADKLEELRRKGLRLGVVTRNCRAAVLAVFPTLLDHVDALHARDDTAFLKPDPRHLQLCCEALGLTPTRTAMVGDGALDMHVGRRLNMYCIGVLSGSSDALRLTEAGAHLIVDNALDLPL